jgi:hypothetical protein
VVGFGQVGTNLRPPGTAAQIITKSSMINIMLGLIRPLEQGPKRALLLIILRLPHLPKSAVVRRFGATKLQFLQIMCLAFNRNRININGPMFYSMPY